MNDKQQLAAMGEHMADEAHEEWESGDDWRLYCPDHKWRAMLAAAPNPDGEHSDAQVSISDIASLQRYTLGGNCDSFGQECGAEMEPDDEGEYVLLSEALMLAAAHKPEGK